MKTTETPKPLLSQSIEKWRTQLTDLRRDINETTDKRAFQDHLSCMDGLLTCGLVTLYAHLKKVKDFEIECGDRERGESIRFMSRGVGLDVCPGCFVCGAEKRNPEANHYLHNIAAFTDNPENGETLVGWFHDRARLDFREDNPERIQVKVGACDAHLPHLEFLDRRTAVHNVIRKIDIEEAIGYFESAQPEPKTKATPAELYDHMLKVAKANGFESLTAAITAGVQWRESQSEKA